MNAKTHDDLAVNVLQKSMRLIRMNRFIDVHCPGYDSGPPAKDNFLIFNLKLHFMRP